MEFPDLGSHCSESSCNKLDFLPIKCDECSKLFCGEHVWHARHGCTVVRDAQVPLCPLCGAAVPGRRGERPDVAVGEHIDNQCATPRNKIFKNRCARVGCRGRELVRMVCSDCGLNYCVRHRHAADHECTKVAEAAVSRSQNSSKTREWQNNKVTDIQGSLSEDEALARALSLSMQPESSTGSQQRCNVS